MKKANTDREILHILSNLRNFNGIFRKGVTCDDIKSHKKKQSFTLSFEDTFSEKT